MSNSIRYRIVVPLVRKGGVGKSTEALIRADWMTSRGVQWKGYDLDDEQRTFRSHFPDNVALVPPSEERQPQIAEIVQSAGDAAGGVTLIDPKAHSYEAILDVLRLMVGGEAGENLRRDGGRVTVVLYPADDDGRLRDIQETIAVLNSSVDYLLVDNTEVHRSSLDVFRDSELASALHSMGVRTIRLPALWDSVRRWIAAAGEEAGRPLSFLEASRSKHMEVFHRMFLESWIGPVFRGYDRASDVLLPSEDAERIAANEEPAATNATTQERKYSFAKRIRK